MWGKPNRVARSRGGLKRLLSFHDYYSSVHLLDVEWLLSTLFDASLFRLRAAGTGGSFFASADGARQTEGGWLYPPSCTFAIAAAEQGHGHVPRPKSLENRKIDLRPRPLTLSLQRSRSSWRPALRYRGNYVLRFPAGVLDSGAPAARCFRPRQGAGARTRRKNNNHALLEAWTTHER